MDVVRRSKGQWHRAYMLHYGVDDIGGVLKADVPDGVELGLEQAVVFYVAVA